MKRPVLPNRVLMLVTAEIPGLESKVAESIAGGVNVVQYRWKGRPGPGFHHGFARINSLLKEPIMLIANGNWEEALQFGSRVIHLPESSVSVSTVRARGGDWILVGKSVHSVASSKLAADEGADYLIAGSIFATQSHPGIEPQGLGFLKEVCSCMRIPVIAIGGITPVNALECMQAGAAGVAVLSGILHADAPREAAARYARAIAG